MDGAGCRQPITGVPLRRDDQRLVARGPRGGWVGKDLCEPRRTLANSADGDEYDHLALAAGWRPKPAI
jgi:hypothetical protein